jgi:hypothetical protein
MAFTGQTDIYIGNLRPIRFHHYSRSFGGVFSEMHPGANCHANPAFGAT